MGKSKNSNANGSPGKGGDAVGKRELIVITKPEFAVRAHAGRVASASDADVEPLAKVLSFAGVELEPLFGDTEERIEARAAEFAPTEAAGERIPKLSTFYNVDAPEKRMEELRERLLEVDSVEAAYIKPPAELAVDEEILNDMEPAFGDAPAATPDFTPRQIYLNPAPAGIDARYAWTMPGGRGRNVRIIDLEWGWNFTHEDLLQNQGGVVGGTNSTNNDHGTAVLGEYSGDVNSFGVTGICADAIASAVAFSMPTSRAIRIAADHLRAGDIMLLEIHRAGPNATGSGQFGYIAVEWWPDDFAAIRYAVNRGVIVVEAAGNGFQDLDDPIYDQPQTGFPASWTNPFNPANPTSNAVVVGAGAPPPGTHGNDHGPDRSRLGFSNYGRRVDGQGWGREVTSTGYGDLQGGTDQNRWYTDRFSGTSSASPIVVGALGCVQGILREQAGTLLTPSTARDLVRTTGSPQTDAPSRPRTQRIGNRPDLRQMIGAVTKTWHYNVTVNQAYATTDSQNAWAYINGVGWRKISPNAPDGVTNVFKTLCDAVANAKTVGVYLDGSFIYRAIL